MQGTASKKVLHLPSSYTETKAVYFHKGPLFSPKCEIVSNKYDNEELHSQKNRHKINSLEKVSHNLPEDTTVDLIPGYKTCKST